MIVVLQSSLCIKFVTIKGEMSVVLLLDMSAAFGLVDYGCLTKMLGVYGFHEDSCNFFMRYRTQQYQKVLID